MKSALIVTFSGTDRPGLVEAVSKVVTGHGGNWERSRMARLGGHFAGLLEVTVEEGKAQALQSALERVEGLTVRVERSVASGGAAPGQRLRLQLTGQDRPGIVREVASALALRGINIEDLETEAVSAPMSGEMLFNATAELSVPQGLTVADLRKGLEGVSQDLMVDIQLAETTPGR